MARHLRFLKAEPVIGAHAGDELLVSDPEAARWIKFGIAEELPATAGPLQAPTVASVVNEEEVEDDGVSVS